MLWLALLVPALLDVQPLPPEIVFDGQTLRGWRGAPELWTVRDGCIVGSSVGRELRDNSFLVLDGREPGDFEFAASFRLVGDNNSGVQYRSRLLGGGEGLVAGWQCDIHPTPNYLGMLYDELGAGIVARQGQLVRWTDDGVEFLGSIARVRGAELSAWHRLRIVARGDLAWHELDGRVVCAVQDLRTSAPRRGVLALQLHAGAPMTVWFKDLELVEYADAAALAAAPPVPAVVHALLRRADLRSAAPRGQCPYWLWDESAADGEELFFRRSFALTAPPRAARLAVACDNHCRVYVNGVLALSDDSWESPTIADVAAHLVAGDNVIAVHAWNDAGPAGLALRLAWRDADGERELVSDGSWRLSGDDPDGWRELRYDDSSWARARMVAALGQPDAPWTRALAADALGTLADPFAPQIAVVDFELDGPWLEAGAPGGAAPVLHLCDVPRELGSWVSLCADDRGCLYASDQRAGLYRIEPAALPGEPTRIERVPVQLGGAQGLLWWRDALYAVVNGEGSGLYRVVDSDGDDQLDCVELLQALEGHGEHGPHSVVVAPDGEHLLVVCGNHTRLPPLAASRVPTNWAEDRLVPRLDDPHPYWEGHSPPGGFVCQVDAAGRNWELICCGLRNPYDLAVLRSDLVVTYDADMEWDMGLPWYRPTRLLHVKSGVDYGWRIGSAKWPADLPEAPPSLADIGPGSPVGVAAFGGRAAERELLLLDWTFGTIYAARVAFAASATSPRTAPVAAVTPAVMGVPWPLVDVVVTPNGAFALTGGRGLASALKRLPLVPHDDGPGTPPPGADLDPWAALRDLPPDALLDEWAGRDPVAARIALEHLPVADWRAAALAVDSRAPAAALVGLLALARQGEAFDLDGVLAALGMLTFDQLAPLDRIAWLRVHALALLRLGPVADHHRQVVAARLLPLFPQGDERLDQDLCELLAFVDARGLLEVAVPLLQPLRPSLPPPWAEVIRRNAVYGPVIARMLDAMPPIGQLAIADALRTVRHGWTLDQRRIYFGFLAAARQRAGGASYDGYLQRLIDVAFSTCTPAEQVELAAAVGAARAPLPRHQPTPPRGPAGNWRPADLEALAAFDAAGRDLDAGHNLFHAAGCAACHRFAGEGGAGGPDLTSLGNKFSARDVLEAILEPSKVVSDSFVGRVLTRTDGSVLFGLVRDQMVDGAPGYEVLPAASDAAPVLVPQALVRSLEPSPRSPMPEGLLDRLSADEVRDLVAFLLARGRR